MKAISSIVLSSYYGPTERNHAPLTLKHSWLEDVIAHQQRMGPYFKYASMQAGREGVSLMFGYFKQSAKK